MQREYGDPVLGCCLIVIVLIALVVTVAIVGGYVLGR